MSQTDAEMSEAEYAAIERRLLSTERGRRFLAERDRRNRLAGCHAADDQVDGVTEVLQQIEPINTVLKARADTIMEAAEQVETRFPAAEPYATEIVQACIFPDEAFQRLQNIEDDLKQVANALHARGVAIPNVPRPAHGTDLRGYASEDGLGQNQVDDIMFGGGEDA